MITLADSDLYAEDKEQAHELWDQGFRPVEANTLKVGQFVAIWTTDVFRLGGEGHFFLTKVTHVEQDEWGFSFRTDDGSTTEADENQEVWAK